MTPANNTKGFRILESKEEIAAFVNQDDEILLALGIEKKTLPTVRTCSILKALIRLGNENANSKPHPIAISAQQILDYFTKHGNEECFTLEEIELTLKQVAFSGLVYTRYSTPRAWRWFGA